MENSVMSKSTVGVGLAIAIVSIFNGLLVILKESVEPVMNWMKALTSHHWITHGVFDILLFLILAYIFSRMNLEQKIGPQKMVSITIWSTIIGTLLIVGFIFLV